MVCLCLHPGTVNTDLSKPYQHGVPKDKLFSVEYSVGKLLNVIDNASIRDSGRFMDYAGKDIIF